MNFTFNAGATLHSTATPAGPSFDEISAAASRLQIRADRGDEFAGKWAPVAHDIAAKLRRWGSYASIKQAEFAAKLVAWSQPRERQADGKPVVKLFQVMQRHAELTLGDLTISRRNQDSLCWITHRGNLVGKLDAGRLTLFAGKCHAAGVDAGAIERELVDVERDPLEAAKRYGRESGRCCSCGRDLTDPESIAAGIGPVCATKFG